VKPLLRLIALTSLILVGTACRDNLGAPCADSRDCSGDTYCCTEGKCGGGMCTYRCENDRGCPSDMVCRDKKCFFRCATDRDCDDGFACKEKDGRLMCVGD
jgi:hypothetical protein